MRRVALLVVLLVLRTGRRARVAALAFALGCASPQAAIATSANVLAAAGDAAGAVLDTCAETLRRDAAAPEGALGRLSVEDYDRTVATCTQVLRARVVVRETHAALLLAVSAAEAAQALGAEPDWTDAARLLADGLRATEALRRAIQAAKGEP